MKDETEKSEDIIPEDFQNEVLSLIKKCGSSRSKLGYMRDKASDACINCRDEEEEKPKKGEKVPKKYSLKSAPSM